jgi:endonuclease/exonuclease/phosphatase family metal-dependent hydrolase
MAKINSSLFLIHPAACKSCLLGREKNMPPQYQSSSKPQALAWGVEGLIIGCCFLLSSCINVSKITNFSHPHSPRYAKLDLAAKPVEPNKKIIKVVSYNIDLCRKIDKISNFLRENRYLADADIICLQEMNLKGIELLANALQYNYVYYPSAVHPGNQKDFGQAILSKWPIEQDQKILLPFSFKDRYIKIQKCAIGAVVLVNRKKIAVFSVHLGVIISPGNRKKQIQTVISAITPMTDRCIIAGDFNTYARLHTRAVTETLKEAGFDLATKNTGWTYKYWYLLNHKTALDYIFYKGLKLIQAGKISDRSRSDHLPIWADFEY